MQHRLRRLPLPALRPGVRGKAVSASACSLSADIFPVSTQQIPVLARTRPELEPLTWPGPQREAWKKTEQKTLVTKSESIPALWGTSSDLTRWSSEEWVDPKDLPDAALLPGGRPPADALCDLAAQVLQYQSHLLDQSRTSERFTSFGGFDVELRAHFTFRSRLIADEPCVAVLVGHKAVAPPGMTMTAVWTKNHANARGLCVTVANGGSGEIVGFAGFLGQNGLREKLMGLTKKSEVRKALSEASGREPCWQVKLSRRSPGEALTFMGSALQPRLTTGNAELLDLLCGRGSSSHLARQAVIRPKDRQEIVSQEFERLRKQSPAVVKKLCKPQPTRMSSSVSSTCRNKALRKLAAHFKVFPAPSFRVGDGKVVKVAKEGEIWTHLERYGLHLLNPSIGRFLRVGGVALVRKPDAVSQQRVRQKARRVIEGIAEQLLKIGITVDVAEVEVATSVQDAVHAAVRSGSQAVILCSTSATESWYQHLKSLLLTRPAPGLRHMASQWINLDRTHSRPSLVNIALQLCAKVGHSPYVLEPEENEATDETLLCGVDVCHMYNKLAGETLRTFASLSLRNRTGELEKAWLCTGQVDGETIPEEVWQTILTKEQCEGKHVIIHRDGRVTTPEKEFLQDLAADVGVAGGAFHLVEVVKWAGGTPRLYHESGSNAPSGSFLQLSESEALLTSGSCRELGTRNPLLIRVVTAPKYTIEELCRDIFRMCYLSFSTAYAQPRLPVTTRAADKAAYFHTCEKIQQSNEGNPKRRRPGEHLELMSTGRQQYWL